MDPAFDGEDLVSVIVPAYNGARFLEEFSLPSVLAQTYKNWELIVVDDGSSDGTGAAVEAFRRRTDRPVHYFKHERNKGLAAAYNTGIGHAKGALIAFLEQDDMWLPEKLSRQAEAMKRHEGCVCSTSRCWVLDEHSRRIFNVASAAFSGMMAYRSVFDEIGPFDESKELMGMQDGDLRAVLDLKYGVHNRNYYLTLNEPLIVFVRHERSLSSRNNGGGKKFIERYYAICGKYDKPEFNENTDIRELLNFWYTHLGFNLLLAGDKERARTCINRALMLKRSRNTSLIRFLSYLPVSLSRAMFSCIDIISGWRGNLRVVHQRNLFKTQYIEAMRLLGGSGRRVLLVSLQKRGGGALDALGLSRGLCENRFGHEVVISEGNELAGEFTENEYRRVAKIATYGSSGGSFLLNSLLLVRPFRLIAVVRKYRPSVVHITHFHPWAFLIFLSRPFFGYKIVYGIHEDPYSRKDAGNPAVMGPLERMFARWADMVAAYSDYMKSVLERHIPGSRIVMIRPGDYRSFYPNFAHKGFHANGTLKLLFFGPIKEYKGVDVLVRAMAICKERGIDAALTIAGVQGPSKKIINEDEVRSLGIVWIDRFLRREEVGALMEEADVMMIPYKEATQTTPGLLAVAYGLPAIGTKSGGLPEEVRDGVNGLLVDPGDAKGLADVIGRICGNRSLLDEFGKGAKMLYGSEFSSRSIAEKAIREAYEPFFRQ